MGICWRSHLRLSCLLRQSLRGIRRHLVLYFDGRIIAGRDYHGHAPYTPPLMASCNGPSMSPSSFSRPEAEVHNEDWRVSPSSVPGDDPVKERDDVRIAALAGVGEHFATVKRCTWCNTHYIMSFFRAAAVPATCVPWPFRSMQSPAECIEPLRSHIEIRVRPVNARVPDHDADTGSFGSGDRFADALDACGNGFPA